MTDRAIGGFVLIGVVVAFFVALYFGARRHEARMRREGKWDESGPLRPTSDDAFPLSNYSAIGALSRAARKWNRLLGPRGKL